MSTSLATWEVGFSCYFTSKLTISKACAIINVALGTDAEHLLILANFVVVCITMHLSRCVGDGLRVHLRPTLIQRVLAYYSNSPERSFRKMKNLLKDVIIEVVADLRFGNFY